MDKRKHADHYHVVTGLPGYLPNNNWLCETLKEAGDMALYEADSFREAGYDGTYTFGRVVGNRRDGYEVLRHSPSEPGEPTTNYVWQTIRIEPCNEEDCRCPNCGSLIHPDHGCAEGCFEREERD